MKVSIVILTKNGGALFEEVLSSIRRQKFDGEVELLVVDSGSTDGTVERAERYGSRIIRIAPQEFNHGLTRNFGIENTSGEIIVLMTQDAVPQGEQWLRSIVDSFNDDKIAGVYVKQVPRPDADVLTKRNLNNWLTGRNEYSVQWVKSPEEFQNLSPADKFYRCVFDNVCSAVRRRAWKNIPFQKNDFGEDIEWAKRALLAGWKIVYQPNATVIHSHNRSIVYEYKRNYMCHRKLYQLFGLQLIPSLRSLFLSSIIITLKDVLFVLLSRQRLTEKIRLIFRVPFLTVACAVGQYRGARDEKNSVGVKMDGV